MKIAHSIQKIVDRVARFARPSYELERDPVQDERFEALRSWRNDLARSRNIRPFRILSNRTLRAIVEGSPATQEELLAVRGMGPVKLMQYGEAILEVLENRH